MEVVGCIENAESMKAKAIVGFLLGVDNPRFKNLKKKGLNHSYTLIWELIYKIY